MASRQLSGVGRPDPIGDSKFFKMKKKLSHIDSSGMPAMVDVSGKGVTERIAAAQAVVALPKEVLVALEADELITRKGPVFQTAIIAGVMAAKRTHELIPLQKIRRLICPDSDPSVNAEGDAFSQELRSV